MEKIFGDTESENKVLFALCLLFILYGVVCNVFFCYGGFTRKYMGPSIYVLREVPDGGDECCGSCPVHNPGGNADGEVGISRKKLPEC
uniref:Uncharacterized protein n=1 Tax=Camellia chlorotic dwarf-associated virus TaxID=2122733 RepID=A0A5J6D3W8_9GEMI|nr:hypothetical protein [Camellia chlorotic dwarf-associated virus]